MVRQDARAFLAGTARGAQRFDVVICDPPSFSTRRSDGSAGSAASGSDPADEREGDFDVQRDHPALVRQCLDVLAPGGVLWFSTNHQRFEPALGDLGAAVREVTDETLPPDYRRRAHRCFRITAAPVAS